MSVVLIPVQMLINFFINKSMYQVSKSHAFLFKREKKSQMIIVESLEEAKISPSFRASSQFKYYNRKMIDYLSHIIIANITA